MELLDTTLRDGAQGEGIEHSIDDMRKIAQALDRLGLPLIEGGNPYANPKDETFFQEAKKKPFLQRSQLVPFGSTRRANTAVEEDRGLEALLYTGQPVISLVGKTSLLHVTDVLQVSPEENLRMIEESVAFLKAHSRRVLYDAEHFFDGCAVDRDYAFATLRAAAQGGADVLVLCDTNGGTMPDDLRARFCESRASLPDMSFGIHCHDDMGLAAAGTLQCVQAGATMAQGTVEGVGERCGNTNLCTLIPTLMLKLRYEVLPEENLPLLTETARAVADIMNLQPDRRAPYVGYSAFAHKGGMHIDGVSKNQATFEHISPESVGNRRRFILSDQAGRSGVYARMKRLQPSLRREDPRVKAVTDRLKRRGLRGYAYESADASFDLMAMDTLGMRKRFFEVVDFHVLSGNPAASDRLNAQAYIKIAVDGREEINAAEGDGPVNALDTALRKALVVFYPQLQLMRLQDFKVRVLDSGGTASVVRVLIESTDGPNVWSTVGVSSNIIQACFAALCDSVEYFLTFLQEGSF
ncbi:MAG: citramalate synthase [Clostridia bacterium]|nr:citramalate synthase [Clostridia bacterium]